LIRHSENQGLARTLVSGYSALSNLKVPADTIIKIDAQEHRPEKIIEIVDNMSESPIDALFLPVWYWIKNQPRPLMKDISVMIVDFVKGLSPIKKEIVLKTFNQTFPLGYQAFRIQTLEKIVPILKRGVEIYENLVGKSSWGLDLLAILVAANEFENVDFIWGGWSKPWLVNRNPDKIAAQRKKAAVMVDVAEKLGYKVV
jgi:hypothetical protein